MLTRLTQRFPALTASGIYAVVVGFAFWPFWTGRSLLNPLSDQKHVYPFRRFAVEYLKEHGDVAPWNPYIFGGMPFAANVTNGDTFYPGALLRLFLPVDAGITLGFMIHLVLAGVFTFLFLRALKLDWGPAFVGGAAYMFTGQLFSLVTAGHDGKLVVSALLPLALLCLYRAVSRADWRWYLAFGGTVTLSVLSPHVQMTYYLLMAAGFFWLFMVVWSGERPAGHSWLASGLLFVLGLAVGFGLSAIQSLPFVEYIGYSPRGAAARAAGASSTGWEYATSWAMPPEELLNVVWPSFSGMVENYWGRNPCPDCSPLKLHSEYLGVASLILACLGLRLVEVRRFAWFFVFLIVYAVLFSLGGHTPFYRLPYHLLPMIKMTRGASMIFFLASFSVAVLAGFGTQAVLRAVGKFPRTAVLWWVGGLGAAALLALVGASEGIMLSFAPPNRVPLLEANYATFTFDAVRGFVIALGAAGLLLALRAGRLTGEAWGLALGGLVLIDLFSVESRQLRFGPSAEDLFAADQVVRTITQDREPRRASDARVLPMAGYVQDNYLMAHGLRSVLGYQGTELHRYDELLGGKNVWRNLTNPNLWRLLAVKYVVLSQPVDFPGLTPMGQSDGAGRSDGAGQDAQPLTTYQGDPVYLYRFDQAEPYARVVAEARKVPDEQALPTLLNPRFDPTRLLLVPPDAPTGVSSLPLDSAGREVLPEPVAIDVEFTQLRAGRLRFDLRGALSRPAYLFVSENYYPAWRATVDGRDAPVVRAQYALMAVPLPAGARSVELVYRSSTYRIGRLITLFSIVLVLGALVGDRVRGRREPVGG